MNDPVYFRFLQRRLARRQVLILAGGAGAAAILAGCGGKSSTSADSGPPERIRERFVGWRACQANQRVLFTTAMDMLNHLLASQVDHSLVRKLKAYTEPALLICDELGYLALDQQSSNLFYQVISTRHGQHAALL